jgi:enoyl-CoA hydratase/carnithine racemase
MKETILTTTKEGIVFLELNRPDKSNAISRALLHSFRTDLQTIFEEKKARVLVLKGAGKAFCAGADLEERRGMTDTEVIQFLDDFRTTLLILEEIHCPTIAAIQGAAFGGGLELTLACDIRLMSDSSQIGLTETRLGIIPGAGGTQRLSRIVGISQAMSLIFRGKKMNSSEALRYGVVNEVYPALEFSDKVIEFAKEILDSAPLAVQLARKAIRKGYSQNLQAALDTEREFYLETLKTKDRIEALNAFREKRKPIFTGE